MHTVLCVGCFDVLTLFHVRHFQAARAFGDRLVVSVTADAFVNKGVGRPIFSENIRAELLRALSCVDEVIINEVPTAVDLILELKPSFLAKGSEYQSKPTANLLAEQAAVESVGGQLVFTSGPEFHSTEIMRRIMCL